MSRYYFLSTNKEIPEVDNTNSRIITVKEAIELGMESPHIPFEELDPDGQVLIIDPEKENELIISRNSYFEDFNLSGYDHQYEVKFGHQEDKLPQLLSYLKDNVQHEQEIECWNILVSDEIDDDIPYARCNYDELSLEYLTNWFQQDNYCLVIYREKE